MHEQHVGRLNYLTKAQAEILLAALTQYQSELPSTVDYFLVREDAGYLMSQLQHMLTQLERQG